jgi:hypothetical protein
MPTPEEMAQVLGEPQGDWGSAMANANEQLKSRRNTMASMLQNTIGVPGTVMQPIAPQTPGMWSDEDEARLQATNDAATKWAPQEAFNMMGSGAPAAERGAAGIFGGKLSKTANMPGLLAARVGEIRKSSPEDIWAQTGWYKGHEGKWKNEIPDSKAWLKRYPGQNTVMGDVLEHPDLYKSYPDLKNIPVIAGLAEPNAAFHAHPEWGSEFEHIGTGEAAPEVLLPNILHELQHAVQSREGFARGGTPAGMSTPVTKALEEHGYLKRDDKGKLQYTKPVGDVQKLRENLKLEAYKRLAGETEAYNVSNRFNFDQLFPTIEDRLTDKRPPYTRPPWETEDVHPSKVILRRLDYTPADWWKK